MTVPTTPARGCPAELDDGAGDESGAGSDFGADACGAGAAVVLGGAGLAATGGGAAGAGAAVEPPAEECGVDWPPEVPVVVVGRTG